MLLARVTVSGSVVIPGNTLEPGKETSRDSKVKLPRGSVVIPVNTPEPRVDVPRIIHGRLGGYLVT
ncbi:unnamed protein product [Arabidopsis thaliana]|uniref:Uncharacterized protein n=1 Tax=Arabidopsis thaliana TaxID=3702 RepID=A0A5S9XHE4_ARATH|nr:unnamed protein product [Arabidopsis thaliana]